MSFISFMNRFIRTLLSRSFRTISKYQRVRLFHECCLGMDCTGQLMRYQ